MRFVPIVLALLLSMPAFAVSSRPPRTTNNDDSCDIALQPAATLLLPYFEVDFKSPVFTATTTLFNIQNVSPYPQIANMTLWTDWGFPAFSYPLFLTGYDVQEINLYDIFLRGRVAPGPNPSVGGTSFNTPVPVNPTAGSQPFANAANPNHLAEVPMACAALDGVIPETIVADLQLMFSKGKGSGAGIGCTAQVGESHDHAIGYVTIDVVATCSAKNPSSADYFAGTALFDNVLVGDYEQYVPRGENKTYFQGGSLVHIRAVPEGGPAGTMSSTSLPYTFYDRYTAALPQRTADRRQPLPSTFAARCHEGGTGAFNTSYKIWREGLSPGTCAASGPSSPLLNSSLFFAEVVRFDEHENATVSYPFGFTTIAELPPPHGTPSTLILPSTSYFFPPHSTSGDLGGWLYMNLNNGGSNSYSVGQVAPGFARDFRTNTSTTTGVRQSQNWVIASMFAEPAYAIETTAPALGNGCSPSPKRGAQIGPAANPSP